MSGNELGNEMKINWEMRQETSSAVHLIQPAGEVDHVLPPVDFPQALLRWPPTPSPRGTTADRWPTGVIVARAGSPRSLLHVVCQRQCPICDTCNMSVIHVTTYCIAFSDELNLCMYMFLNEI